MKTPALIAASAAMTALAAPAVHTREFGRKHVDDSRDEKDIKADLKETLDKVKTFAEGFDKKHKEGLDVSKEAKSAADEALSALTGLRAELTELAQKGTRNGDDTQAQIKSLGQQVGASEEFKEWAEKGAAGTLRMELKAVTSASGSGGALIVNDRQGDITALPRKQFRVRDLLTPGRTTSNNIEFARQLARTNNAAPTAETTQKPESNYTWEVTNAPVRTIAHWVPASRQAMDDIPQLESLIDGELRYGLDDVEDAQLLMGDGTGQNIEGLYPTATAYSAPITIAGATRIDQLRLALLQVELMDYAPDGIVINPAAWAGIELTKDSAGGYIFANPQSLVGPVLWGRPVVPTKAIGATNFLVGPFKLAGQIFDRMETEVRISDQDRDNFVKNMLTIRAEKRLALAKRRPASLVRGTLL